MVAVKSETSPTDHVVPSWIGWMDGCVTRPEKQALTQLLSGENKSFQTARIQHIFWAFLSRKTLP